MIQKSIVWCMSILFIAQSTFATNMPTSPVVPTSSKIRPWYTTNTTSTSSKDTKTILACLQTAAVNRETTIVAASKIYAEGISNAFVKRASDISAAYGSGKTIKEIKPLIKAAFTTFTASIKSVKTTFKTSRGKAWTDHKIAVKSCKPDTTTLEAISGDTTVSENEGF